MSQPECWTTDAVDERIAATVAHGQPMGDQEDEVDIFELVYSWLTHAGQEVDMVGEPAEAEDDHHRDQHHHGLLLLVEILPVLGDGAVAPVARGYWPPEPEGHSDIGVADDQQGDQVLEAHTQTVVHGVEAGHEGVIGHVAERGLLFILGKIRRLEYWITFVMSSSVRVQYLCDDPVLVENEEGSREQGGGRPDEAEEGPGVTLARPVAKRTGYP